MHVYSKPQQGYIYIRKNIVYFNEYNAVKLGKCHNIPDREGPYITNEVERGEFIVVLEVSLYEMDEIERALQIQFYKDYNSYIDAGTEFFKSPIVELIEPRMMELGYNYRRLSASEISELTRATRERHYAQHMKMMELSRNYSLKRAKQELEQILKQPYEYQLDIITQAVEHFKTHSKGILNLTCGMGKTLLSLWITKQIYKENNTILIAVPNKILLGQWESVIKKDLQLTTPLFSMSGDKTDEELNRFLTKNGGNCIVITTYHSSHKILDATREMGFVFDMKILDEVHHLTGKINDDSDDEEKQNKQFLTILGVASKKQLSLTATLKILENNPKGPDDELMISNNNMEYFGNVIIRRGLLWAIQKEIVCDYEVQTLITHISQMEEHTELFNITNETDKRLFLSAFVALKSVTEKHSHHLLIYCNSTEHSTKICKYITKLLECGYFTVPLNFYYSDYHSRLQSKDLITIEKKFSESASGILTSVYKLGEGYDLPLLDGVVFSENMTSAIRILQSALRASRKNKNEPKKKTKIIVPILYSENWLDDTTQDFVKIREIIYQMGLEDELISQKMKVTEFMITQENKEESKEDRKDNKSTLDEFDEKLTNELRLKTIPRIQFDVSYEKAKKIIVEWKEKHQLRFTTKGEYTTLCGKDVRLSRDPEEHYGNSFKNWADYLGIADEYYTLEDCKGKVKKYLRENGDISKLYPNVDAIAIKLCELDENFPPSWLWAEYYNVNKLTDIINNNTIKKKQFISFK
jgi:superfamily II DNA or RNA helicase